jgi:hypothetical protein
MGSCNDIPGRIGPSKGSGRLSTARLMSSGVMFIQSVIPFKVQWVQGSREMPSRIIVVHVITVIIKVHFTIFMAVNRRWTWNTCSCFGTEKSYIVYDIVYDDIGYDIEDDPKRQSLYTAYYFDIEEKPSISGTIFDFDSLCTLNVYTISKFLFDIG